MGTTLDELFEGLPVLMVDDYESGLPSAEELETLWVEKFAPMIKEGVGAVKLRREYWFSKIERKRIAELDELGLSNVDEQRSQCWGYLM